MSSINAMSIRRFINNLIMKYYRRQLLICWVIKKRFDEKIKISQYVPRSGCGVKVKNFKTALKEKGKLRKLS